MKLGSAPVLALLLISLPCQAIDVEIDYDTKREYRDVKTFAWIDTPETSLEDDDPYMHSRIVNAIANQFAKGGMTEVDPEDDPDVDVTYHAETSQELRVDTTTYGYGSSWYWRGDRASRPPAETFKQGTLVVDIWDPETKTLIWRGTITAAVPENPSSAEKTIVKGLNKLVAQWQKIRKQAAKP